MGEIMTLFWLGILWIAGVGAAVYTDLTSSEWLILSLISGVSAYVFRSQKPFLIIYCSLLVITLGGLRGQLDVRELGPKDVSWYNDTGTYTTITGVVVKPPDVRDAYIGLQIETDSLRFGEPGSSFPVTGQILVRTTRFEDWNYGDRVVVQGFLDTPPKFETFDYREYLARKDVLSIVQYASVKYIASGEGNAIAHLIFKLRSNALRVIQTIFPDPEASLLSGILVGMERGIPPQVQDDFNATGTTHIIAISGFNITIIAAIFMSFFRRVLGTRRGLIAAGIGIFFYTVLVGGDAAVVRAAIMGALTLLALRLGRQTYGFASLSAAAIVMTALDPDVLWDVGFQLSFAATLGLMVFTPPLERGFLRLSTTILPLDQAKSLLKPVSEFFLFTLAAQVMTLPLSAIYFQQLSLTSFIANPVILPVQPLLMITGGIATLLGMVSITLGRVLAIFAWPFSAFTIRAVSFFADLPTGNFKLGMLGPTFVVLWYFALLLIVLFIYVPKDRRPQIQLPTIRTSSTIVVLSVIAILTWRASADQPDGNLHITILDVGMGDAALVQSPDGRHMLIDGGPSPIRLSDALGTRLPLFNRSLDWLILTGTKEEQLGGLAEVIPRFTPSEILLAGPPRTGAYRYFVDQVSEAGIPQSRAISGQSFILGNGCTLEVLSTSDQGATLLISYGNFYFLFAPAADPSQIESLSQSRSTNAYTAVLLPDGGSEVVNSAEWLQELNPTLVIISVGAGNTRGLPSETVLEALEGRTILRTDLNGIIDVVTDGEQMWVEVERVVE